MDSRAKFCHEIHLSSLLWWEFSPPIDFEVLPTFRILKFCDFCDFCDFPGDSVPLRGLRGAEGAWPSGEAGNRGGVA